MAEKPISQRKNRRPIISKRLAGVRLTVQRNTSKPPYQYVLTIHANGKRRVRYFRHQKEAETALELACVETANSGAEIASLITDSDKRALAEFYRATADWPKQPTITEVLNQWLADHAAKKKGVTVPEAVRERLELADRVGRSKKYLADMRIRLSRFAADFESRFIGTLTATEVEQWLHNLALKPNTLAHYKRLLTGLFSFAIKRGWAAENVALRVTLPTSRASCTRHSIARANGCAAGRVP